VSRWQDEYVSFAEELARVLPADLPHRERVIELSAKHLALIAEANEYMNLTRISSRRSSMWPIP